MRLGEKDEDGVLVEGEGEDRKEMYVKGFCWRMGMEIELNGVEEIGGLRDGKI